MDTPNASQWAAIQTPYNEPVRKGNNTVMKKW